MRDQYRTFRFPTILECIYGNGVKEVHIVYPFAGVDEFTSYVYPLTEDNLAIIPEDCQYGTYRIGYVLNDKFFVRYIGRSIEHQDGLRGRVREHLNDFPGNPYFMYFEAKDAEEAYRDECLDFHSFYEGVDGYLSNREHPNRDGVRDTTIHCPVGACNE